MPGRAGVYRLLSEWKDSDGASYVFRQPHGCKKERHRKLDATMDAIRQKFGNDKITRASIMNSNTGIARKARAQMKNEDEKK